MAEDKELKSKIDDMKKKIMILEWDKGKNQLNPGKQVYLDNLKEKLGIKPNTVRFDLPEWKKNKLKEATHIRMHRGYTKTFFVREITDKTEWKNCHIISWNPNSSLVKNYEAQSRLLRRIKRK